MQVDPVNGAHYIMPQMFLVMGLKPSCAGLRGSEPVLVGVEGLSRFFCIPSTLGLSGMDAGKL